ncbi:ATP-binding protein [Nibricoccus aquaticus]|uniref:ATP-binding protein n=1 Tax=Nibricoccus aquaticus TaxID=2576891 RepID=A0A290Q4K3_9BACT|nr:beta-L-arabinofuranosidase domain-containing protein [Nibricoccus aquaticus]ATC63333.1 ATP-binding protein [Nibricoccus aquaticus]
MKNACPLLTRFRLHLSALPLVLAAFSSSATISHAAEKSLIDTTKSPHAAMYMTDLADVRWTTGLWAERFEACRTTMIPHMWSIFKDDYESHAWSNFLVAAGMGAGRDGKKQFHGPPFNDGDFLKWVEALVQVYAVTKDPAIDKQLDEIITVVAKAQREDGYLHTQKIIPQRQGLTGATAKEFEDREHFETYNMGHLITTACIHYRVTGKTNFLDCARKAADYIDNLCKTVPKDLAKNAICPSHYMAVIELYRVTREPRYLELGKQLIEIRSLFSGKEGSDQNQDRTAFRETFEAVGHAVRANYLYAGVADVVAEDGDKTLFKPLEKISEDIATQKLYITGMTGAIYDAASPDGAHHTLHPQIKTIHQAYGRDYQLPNITAYNETCATIGYGMWIWRMLTLTGDAQYADLFEQTLYNGILPGISLEGKHYFYVNPLRTDSEYKWPLRWSRTRQPNYKASFCCPPNIVRTIAEAHNYAYTLSENSLWVQLYAANTLDTKWTDGARIKLRQETDYPYDGAVKITIDEAPAKDIALKLRIPGWLHKEAATLKVNGTPVSATLKPGSFAEVKRTWKAGDVVTLDLAFKPVLLEANPLVEETVNQVTVKYGPLVYCLEAADLPKGVRLADVVLSLDPKHRQFTPKAEKIVNANLTTFTVPAFQLQRDEWKPDQLYREVGAATLKAIDVKFVPYFAWDNRGTGDMSVWVPVR